MVVVVATVVDDVVVEEVVDEEDEELALSQSPAGAPSAHFNWLFATPLQTSSMDKGLPSRTKA